MAFSKGEDITSEAYDYGAKEEQTSPSQGFYEGRENATLLINEIVKLLEHTGFAADAEYPKQVLDKLASNVGNVEELTKLKEEVLTKIAEFKDEEPANPPLENLGSWSMHTAGPGTLTETATASNSTIVTQPENTATEPESVVEQPQPLDLTKLKYDDPDLDDPLAYGLEKKKIYGSLFAKRLLGELKVLLTPEQTKSLSPREALEVILEHLNLEESQKAILIEGLTKIEIRNGFPTSGIKLSDTVFLSCVKDLGPYWALSIDIYSDETMSEVKVVPLALFKFETLPTLLLGKDLGFIKMSSSEDIPLTVNRLPLRDISNPTNITNPSTSRAIKTGFAEWFQNGSPTVEGISNTTASYLGMENYNSQIQDAIEATLNGTRETTLIGVNDVKLKITKLTDSKGFELSLSLGNNFKSEVPLMKVIFGENNEPTLLFDSKETESNPEDDVVASEVEETATEPSEVLTEPVKAAELTYDAASLQPIPTNYSGESIHFPMENYPLANQISSSIVKGLVPKVEGIELFEYQDVAESIATSLGLEGEVKAQFVNKVMEYCQAYARGDFSKELDYFALKGPSNENTTVPEVEVVFTPMHLENLKGNSKRGLLAIELVVRQPGSGIGAAPKKTVTIATLEIGDFPSPKLLVGVKAENIKSEWYSNTWPVKARSEYKGGISLNPISA